ncbi:hypothetical protein [Arthrobacter ramosus]|uniref:Lipoprotein n=1 Tax=Arthrobacter ramosus TaxID=1672 RepID=A0ABV5Y353_ARTRM|nr:hypothetical protein [Arthrobacter ramosus]
MSSVSSSRPAAFAAACAVTLAACASPPNPPAPGPSPSSAPPSASIVYPPLPSESATITVQLNTHGLIPAVSSTVTAGVCERAVGPVAVVVINPDIPTPRCQTVAGSQGLEIVNRTGDFGSTGKTATIRWEPYPTVSLEPGQAAMFSGQFGAYLAPGDHLVSISVYAGGGAEIYLRDATQTTGPR